MPGKAHGRWRPARPPSSCWPPAAASGDSDDTEACRNSISIGIARAAAPDPDQHGGVERRGRSWPRCSTRSSSSTQRQQAGHRPRRSPITPDKTTRVWTIKLKPGFTFGNGEPVTADSYINAWNYGAYGPNDQSASYFFERIDGYADLQSVDPDEDGPKKAAGPRPRR